MSLHLMINNAGLASLTAGVTMWACLMGLAMIGIFLIPCEAGAEPICELWSVRVEGVGDTDLVTVGEVDDSGYSVLTGRSIIDGQGADAFTVRLSPSGDTVWTRRYAGPSNAYDEGWDVKTDSNLNVYVAGATNISNADFLTIKYAPDGSPQWVRTFNATGNWHDAGWVMEVSPGGNVFVAGFAATTVYAATTIAYNTDGDSLWVNTYPGHNGVGGALRAIALDDDGNIYAAGESGVVYPDNDLLAIKYLPNGDTAWTRTYNGPGNGNDVAWSIVADTAGNVCVAGISRGSLSDDYVIIKYLPNGDTAWVRHYNGPANGNDYGLRVAMDDSGNAIMAGQSTNAAGNFDALTIKYTSSGDTAWTRRYNGPGNGEERIFDLQVDSVGSSYVAMYSLGSGTSFDFAAVKYSAAGAVLWTQRYNSPDNTADWLARMTVDSDGDFYLFGTSVNPSAHSQYRAVRYSQHRDADNDGTGDACDVCTDTDGDGRGDPGYPANTCLADNCAAVANVGQADADNDGEGDACDLCTDTDGDGRGNPGYAANTCAEDNCPTAANPLQEDGNSNGIGDLCEVNDTLYITLYSPVDMVVTDPYGDSIGLDSLGSAWLFNTILNGSTYDTAGDFNGDLHADDRIVIPHPAEGPYRIRIIPEPSADGSDQFTLSIRINGNQLLYPDGYKDASVSSLGTTLPDTYLWVASTVLTGDLNADGNYTSSDIILLVNYVFKSGTPPNPTSIGDINCSGAVTSADIITLVNHVFKSSLPPCSGSG